MEFGWNFLIWFSYLVRIKKKSTATPAGSSPSQGAGATPTQEEQFRGFQPLGPPATPGGGSQTASPMAKPTMANPYANPKPGTSKAKDSTARGSGMPSAIDRRKAAANRKKKLVKSKKIEWKMNGKCSLILHIGRTHPTRWCRRDPPVQEAED